MTNGSALLSLQFTADQPWSPTTRRHKIGFLLKAKLLTGDAALQLEVLKVSSHVMCSAPTHLSSAVADAYNSFASEPHMLRHVIMLMSQPFVLSTRCRQF